MDHVKSRTSFHYRINKILQQTIDHKKNPLSLVDCKVLEETVKETYEKAETAHLAVISTCTQDDAIKTQEGEMDKVTESFHRVRKNLTLIKDSLSSSSSSSVPVTTTTKLPQMELPKFKGSYEGWPQFKDLFTANISSRSSLTAGQKLQYLKSCVIDEASKLISSLTITDSNYAVAWSVLEARYDNKREVISTLVRKLLSLSQIKSESASHLQQLHDNTMDSIRQLRVMGRPVDKWDDILCEIVLSKLDCATKAEWAKTLTGTDPPTFKDLEAFLEKHIRVLMAKGSSTGTNHPTKEHAPKSTRFPTEKKHINSHSTRVTGTQPMTCGVCKQPHPTFQCGEFRALTPKQRFEACQRAHLCTNCLQDGHRWRDCDRGSCRICGKKHSTLLHEWLGNSTGSVKTQQQSPRDGKPPQEVQNPQGREAPRTSSNIATSVQSYHSSTDKSVQQTQRVQETSRVVSSPQDTNDPRRSNSSTEAEPIGSHHSSHAMGSPAAPPVCLLKTAIVLVADQAGSQHKCRALLDDCSEGTFMTEAFATKLGFPRTKEVVKISGVGGTETGQASTKVHATLSSRLNSRSIDIVAHIIPKVTGTIPGTYTPTRAWNHTRDILLADPSYNQPGEIDVLLSADDVANALLPGLKKGPKGSPTAQQTIFGWTLMGKVSRNFHKIIRTMHTCTLEDIVQRFWELEKVASKSNPLTIEEKKCEDHFHQTHKRDSEGRFIVRLPFNNKLKDIGPTREQAMKRFLAGEKRLTRIPEHRSSYIQFMREYEELGHMQQLSEEEKATPGYYIPHHFVLKEDSSTTKLRVVFDASMKSSTGTSLNDALLVGPTIQPDLFTLLMRFRTHRIALKADVAKMYRQFKVDENDSHYQRILWRENSQEDVKEYRLTTVTYGTACAPFLATRCLLQMANDLAGAYPLAEKAVRNSMYVDDLVGGEATTSTAIKLYEQLNTMCKSAGLSIRKWCSNSTEVLKHIPEDQQESLSSLDFEGEESIKALGIRWLPLEDTFTFSCNAKAFTASSKRQILSEVASIFDPLGWITPVTITAKILIQSLWRAQLDWDEPIPDPLLQQWQKYCSELQQITQVKIPRCVFSPRGQNSPRDSSYQTIIRSELHAFSDASEQAYAAVIYLRHIYEDQHVSVHLLTSKSKVAPLRQISLPRLELCGAHLAAVLIQSVQTTFPEPTVFGWTDSMVTLQWIQRPSRNWKTYVANRVSAIQEIIPPENWNHVHGEENPADLPSRGVSPPDMLNSRLWWYGPTWLSNPTTPSTTAPFDPTEVQREERPQQVLHIQRVETHLFDNLINAGKLDTAISSVAWLHRFIQFKRKGKLDKTPLLFKERHSACKAIIKYVQRSQFTQEINGLEKMGPQTSRGDSPPREDKPLKRIQARSKLVRLNPFLDQDGILRVGGRLRNSQLPYSTKHPIILPSDSHITTLLIRQCHLRHLHGGFQLTMTALRQEFWIIGGRTKVRNIISKCVPCRKAKAEVLQQQMGDLPTGRITPTRPFLHTAVDFAGPFYIKTRSGRGAKIEKVYMAIFVCFTTKACHLEVVTTLAGIEFIAAYKRFASRRGIPIKMYSDNGTNFVAADKELQQMLSQKSEEITHQLGQLSTTWVFHPPGAPHRNGLAESAVKSAKLHLKKIASNEHFTLEQLQTLFCGVEACLNSRPLSPLPGEKDEFDVLTPGHFLIGEPLTSVPEPDITLQNPNRLTQWKRIQYLSQCFWKQWTTDYLHTLQQRNKWHQPSRNLQVGDIVLIRGDILPQGKWKIGRVLEAPVSPDGLVRKVTLKTATGILERPIQKLSLLVV